MKKLLSSAFAAAITAMIAQAAMGGSAIAADAVNAKAAAMVPDAIKKSGVLRVGTNFPYAPMEFFAEDGKTPTGVDVDLISEVAARLGLKADFVNMNWDGLIPALNSGRFEVIAASVGDFTERQKQADFVDYMTTGVSVVVSGTDKTDYKVNTDLCGKRLSAAKGTDASRMITELAEKCTADGKKTTANQFPDDNAGLLAVRSGRIDGHAMDSISASYEASTEKGRTTFRNVLPDFAPTKAIYGFVIAKGNRPLTDAAVLVLNDMIADGSYRAVLEKYGVADAAIPSATINAGGAQGSGE